MSHSIAVYSCFYGDPEPFNPDSSGAGDGFDRVLFTDRDDLRPDGVRVIKTCSKALGPVYESRRAKMLPHRLLAEYEWVIYVDNRASLRQHPAEIIARIQSAFGPDCTGRYLFEHPDRASVRDELDECFRLGLVSEQQWRALLELYVRVGFRNSSGLTHNAVMICKQGDGRTEQVSELWFELFLHYSKRDQLTLQPAEQIIGAPAHRLGFALSDIAQWPIYEVSQRAMSVQSNNTVEKPPFYTRAGREYRAQRDRTRALISSMYDMARDP